MLKDLTDIVDGFRKNETEMPGIATQITDALDRGWHYATLFFGETQIRTGHVLVGGAEVARASPLDQRSCRSSSGSSTATASPTKRAPSGRSRTRKTCGRWTAPG